MINYALYGCCVLCAVVLVNSWVVNKITRYAYEHVGLMLHYKKADLLRASFSKFTYYFTDEY